jgi:hypothetical protein
VFDRFENQPPQERRRTRRRPKGPTWKQASTWQRQTANKPPRTLFVTSLIDSRVRRAYTCFETGAGQWRAPTPSDKCHACRVVFHRPHHRLLSLVVAGPAGIIRPHRRRAAIGHSTTTSESTGSFVFAPTRPRPTSSSAAAGARSIGRSRLPAPAERPAGPPPRPARQPAECRLIGLSPAGRRSHLRAARRMVPTLWRRSCDGGGGGSCLFRC